MNLFYIKDIAPGQKQVLLPADEAFHCIKVLRLGHGDSIRLTDGTGHFYTATLLNNDTRKLLARIEDFTRVSQTENCYIHLAVAPTKNMDRTEWFVEKATEIGVHKISLLECQFSERRKLKEDRLQKVAVAALKQSQRATLPQIEGLQTFNGFVQGLPSGGQRFMALVRENSRQLKDAAFAGQHYCVLVGPEGGFSDNEFELASTAGFLPVSLGNYRLRTETAATVACTILNQLNF